MKRQKFDEDYEFEVSEYQGFYSVSLPHQCDSWEIIGAEDDSMENDGGYPALPKGKEFAVKQMELFCKRANEALEKLKNI